MLFVRESTGSIRKFAKTKTELTEKVACWYTLSRIPDLLRSLCCQKNELRVTAIAPDAAAVSK